MASEQKLSEPRLSKCGCYHVRRLFKGRDTYGHVMIPVKSKAGPEEVNTYWAKRDSSQVFRRENAWAIDYATISLLRTAAVKRIGVRESDTGRTYVTPIETFHAATPGVESINFSDHIGTSEGAKGKKGAKQWVVPMELWTVTSPPPEEMVEGVMKAMHLPRSRKKKEAA